MPNWVIFYFLWDDPLFTNTSSIDEWELRDLEFIELRREARLLALEILYIRIARLQRALDREKQAHREAQAREVWTINQFLNEVEPEQAEKVLINRKVNEMDPDFSFVEAISR